MRPAEREVVQNELNQVQSEREQQRQQILAAKNKIIGAKMEPLVVETQARLKQHAEQLQQEMQGDMSGVLSKDQSDLAKVPEALTKAMAAIDKQADKLQESNEKLRAGIRNDIESNVIKLAHERQYTIVFHSVKVNIKADDITDDVDEGFAEYEITGAIDYEKQVVAGLMVAVAIGIFWMQWA